MAALWARFSEPDAPGDRRGAPRRMLRLVTRAARADTARDVLILDLSTTGMMIETAEPLAIGDIIEVELPEANLLAARILWRREAFAGCEFLSSAPVAAVSAALLQAAPRPRPSSEPLIARDPATPGPLEPGLETAPRGLILVILSLLLIAAAIFVVTLTNLPFSAHQFGR